ncbi:MAG: hypothetical protein JWP02_3955 [Acidimicrobiales bacterium]|nr:hypothetical protein [Acidimicrobiales bacterium]
MSARSVNTAFGRACRDTGMSDGDLWLRYFGLGGTAPPGEVRAYVRGTVEPDRAQYDTVVHAINERYMELDRPNRLPYSGESR